MASVSRRRCTSFRRSLRPIIVHTFTIVAPVTGSINQRTNFRRTSHQILNCAAHCCMKYTLLPRPETFPLTVFSRSPRSAFGRLNMKIGKTVIGSRHISASLFTLLGLLEVYAFVHSTSLVAWEPQSQTPHSSSCPDGTHEGIATRHPRSRSLTWPLGAMGALG